MGALPEDCRAVMFDVGNTLTTPDWPRIARLAAGHCARGADEADLHRRFCGVLRDADSDENFLRALAGRAVRPGWHFVRVFAGLGVEGEGIKALTRALGEAHVERHLWARADPEAAAVLGELKARGLKLAAVSNTEDGRAAELLEAVGLLGYLDACFDSHLVGYSKPDPKIFLHAARGLGVEPAGAVYVGDSLRQDLFGARAAGLRAILFDPHDLHAGTDAPRVRALRELTAAARG